MGLVSFRHSRRMWPTRKPTDSRRQWILLVLTRNWYESLTMLASHYGAPTKTFLNKRKINTTIFVSNVSQIMRFFGWFRIWGACRLSGRYSSGFDSTSSHSWLPLFPSRVRILKIFFLFLLFAGKTIQMAMVDSGRRWVIRMRSKEKRGLLQRKREKMREKERKWEKKREKERKTTAFELGKFSLTLRRVAGKAPTAKSEMIIHQVLGKMQFRSVNLISGHSYENAAGTTAPVNTLSVERALWESFEFEWLIFESCPQS